jgi:putative transposase
LLWIVARRFCAGWRENLSFVTPETVVCWHRQGWRLFWRWKSRCPGGRPHLTPEVRDLIATISRDNRLWGYGTDQRRVAQAGHRGQQSLHSPLSLAGTRRCAGADLANFPAQPCSPHMGRRSAECAHADVQDTARAGVHRPRSARARARQREGQPTAAWVWRQLIEATPWGSKPRHLLHDRDAVYGRDFRKRAGRIGVDAVATPIHTPKADAIAERIIGTLRRECLDHVIVLDEQHLRSVLA